MSSLYKAAAVACGMLLAASAHAGTYYVATNGNDVAPYDSWTNAARDIQSAVDLATAGSDIIVSNGIYDTGGRAVDGVMTNRVVINKGVTVRSLNGPDVTFIAGQPCPTNGANGNGAVRCVYLANSPTLDGFTLTNGYTLGHESSGSLNSGGGAYASYAGSRNAIISNCVITGCTAYENGGGVAGAIVRACRLTGNTAGMSGGGTDDCVLYNSILRNNLAYGGGGAGYCKVYNCTIVDNVGTNRGGGVAYCHCINSILYYNTSDYGDNFYFWSYTNCCMMPDSSSGSYTVTNEPLFVDRAAGDVRLLSNSPCINAGNYEGWMSGMNDFAGDPRVVGLTVDIGAYEYQGLSDPLAVEIHAPYRQAVVGIGLPFEARITGNAQGYRWTFGDGQWAADTKCVTNEYASTGFYDVVLAASNLAGTFSTTVQVEIVDAGFSYYVATNGSDGAAGTNWATAKQTIQAAVDAAGLGCIVWVTNGVHDRGGRVADSGLTNRVAVDKQLSLFSLNGPDHTCIAGGTHSTNAANGNAAIRCVYLADDAVLGGFTISNGHTRTAGDNYRDCSGGGIYCVSTNAVVTNCLIVANTANRYGGGACRGTLCNCELYGNTATYYGGGAYGSVLLYGLVASNTARSGGGLYGTLACNSIVRHNVATQYGGGVYASSCKICSCAVIGNTAGERGGGGYRTVARNSIFYYNTAPTDDEFYEGTFTNSCTYPLPSGADNITNAPGIVSIRNPRLLPGAACIDRGTNEYWMPSAPDWDAYPRITGASVDIGPCEFYSNSVLTGALSVAIAATYTQAYTGLNLPFEAVIEGRAQGYVWDFDDGSGATGLCRVSHAYGSGGFYDVTLTASNLSGSAAATVRVAVVALDCNYYVRPDGSDGAAGTNWTTAKQTIQAAVDAADMGCTIWVSNGVYSTGGKAVQPGLTNRATVDKVVVVRSVNGPDATSIAGQPCPTNGATGDGAVRCVYLADGAQLLGFALTNGYTLASGGPAADGGGAWCAGSGATISNCLFIACAAAESGGGLYGGSASGCRFVCNTADEGGGACAARLASCGLTNNTASAGGGTYDCTLDDCELNGNSATNTHGGGAYGGTLTGCCVFTNSAADKGGGLYNAQAATCVFQGNTSVDGGGASGGTLWDCTLLDNEATGASGVGGGASQANLSGCELTSNSAVYGGGVFDSTATNCALAGNVALYGGGAYEGTFYNCSFHANTASNGGGIFNGTAYRSAFSNNFAESSHGRGGGACQATLYESWLSRNFADDGGGASLCTLYNCVLMVNTAAYGGGASSSEGFNNTIVNNRATSFGGGTFWGVFHNTIVYYNQAFASPNCYFGYFTNSCANPTPDGANNISSSPQFFDYAAGDVRLKCGSACIDSGLSNGAPTIDFEGAARPVDGDFNGVSKWDMGAYEYDPSTHDSDGDTMLDAWEERYGLNPSDGSDASDESDGDSVINRDEHTADTCPTNGESCFRVTGVERTNSWTVAFSCTNSRAYSLQYATNMVDGSWLMVDGATNAAGDASGAMSFTDTVESVQRHYRVGAALP